MPWTSGARAVVLQRHLAEARRQLLPARERSRLGLAAEPGEPVLRRRAALDRVLHPLRVTGHLRLEALGPALVDDDRGRGHQHAARDRARPVRAGGNASRALDCPRDREHRQRRAGRVRNRDRDDPAADAIGRDVRGQRCEHRPAARDEHEPEARAEEEAAAEVAGAPTSEEAEGPLDELADLGHDQRQREHEQQHRPDLDLVLRADPEQAPAARRRRAGRR